MIHAEMRGRSHVEEDVLTSSAIGLLSLLPDDLFVCFLGTARNLENQYLKELLQGFSRVRCVEYWKTDFPTGVPDVLVELEDESGQEHCAIVIEVKHRSGKSGAALETEDGRVEHTDWDQLARYWKGLVEHYPSSTKAILFLTGHRTFPEEDVRASVKASENKAKLFWASWNDLHSFVSDCLESGSYLHRGSERKILRLLEEYLRFKGYGRFRGWAGLAVVRHGCEPLPVWYARVYGLRLGCNGVGQIGQQYRRRYTWDLACRIPWNGMAWYRPQ